MKQTNMDLSKFDGLQELSFEQMQSIEGGSFWEDASYFLGATFKALYLFGKTAMEYQHSLPANLKK